MIKIEIKHNFGDIQRRLEAQQKHVRFAVAAALTRTAKHAQAETVEEMKRRFDRPTRITLKSIFVKPATKANLTAMVFVKDRALGGKNPLSMAQIIGHQFSGGGRMNTRLENLLRSQRYMAPGEFLVPGAGARLNANGNISAGQIVQILSQIGVTRAGFDSTKTKSARSRRNVQRAGEMFWSYGIGSTGARAHTGSFKFDYETGQYFGKRQHLPKGVWMRVGNGLKPVMLVIRAPNYQRRIFLDKLGQKAIAQHFRREFDIAYGQALATAR